MHVSVNHWGGHPRLFPSAFPVRSVGFIERKDHWVRREATSCCYSLITRGRGEFHRLGKRWDLVAPCVITQWLGEYTEYGPPVPAETWDECFIGYDVALMPKLEAVGLLDFKKPVWPIHRVEAVTKCLDELRALHAAPAAEETADLIDRICERMILHSHLPPVAVQDAKGRVWERILAGVRQQLAGKVDFLAIAQAHGMSESTFRRRWAEVASVSPGRYLLELRMREACRLLVETKQPIRAVAKAVGFENELYFSRRFHAEQGYAPRDYRKAFRYHEDGE